MEFGPEELKNNVVDEKTSMTADENSADKTDGDKNGSNINELISLTETLSKELQEEKEGKARALAESANTIKRERRIMEEQKALANERLLKGLLPIKDSLEAAIDSAASDESNSPLTKGVAATLSMFDKFLKEAGVVSISSSMQPLDPSKHHVMKLEPCSEADDGKVVAILQKGYILGKRLLRPAMVSLGSKNQKPME